MRPLHNLVGSIYFVCIYDSIPVDFAQTWTNLVEGFLQTVL